MNNVDKYIALIDNKYIVHREFNNIDYKFGEFNSLTDAVNFRNKIDADGWPLKKDNDIFTLDGKKPSKIYVKEFVDNQIIYLNRNVQEKDPSLVTIYKNFKEYENNDVFVPLKTFKYYFPRFVDKKRAKRELINGVTRYNVTFVNKLKINTPSTEIKPQKIDNKVNNADNPIFEEIHGSEHTIPYVKEFIKEKITVLNRNPTEYDPILDDIHLEFNEFLKKYNKTIKKNSFSNYFSKILYENKKADKIVLNGKTHYNISFNESKNKKPNKSTILTNNNDQKNNDNNVSYDIVIDEINEICFLEIKGKMKVEYFENFIDNLKIFKKKILTLNIEQLNNELIFQIKMIEPKSNKETLINNLDSSMKMG